MTLEEATKHAGSLGYVPADIREAIRECMPHYLWITTDDTGRRRRYVHCEYCDNEWAETPTRGRYTMAYKAGERTACPYCGGHVYPKYVGRGFSDINDRLNVTWYDKSKIDPEAIVVFGAHCRRWFYRDDRPWLQEPDVEIRSICVITRGAGGHKFKREPRDWQINGGIYPTRFEWVPVKRVAGMTFGSTSFFGMPGADRVDLTDTLDMALRGTAIGRAWHDGLKGCDQDCVRALHQVARYPCCEYLTKLGMGGIIEDRVEDRLPPGLVNWRGKKLTDVLKLTPQRWGELKHAGIRPTSALLMVYRWLDREGYHLTASAAWNLSVLCERWGSVYGIDKALDMLLSIHPATRRQKVLKYIARQADKCGDTRLHLGDFRDYWNLCVRLGEDLREEATAFPSNIREAEARMQARERRERQLEEERVKRNKWQHNDEMIRKAMPKLEREFGFSFGGLTLRPAASCEEVDGEGRALHHCVGGYIDRYAKGDTVICVLRRDVEPDRPWRTVEISPKTGKLIQDRGYRNDTSMGTPLTPQYKAALDLFWEAWGERHHRQRERRTA